MNERLLRPSDSNEPIDISLVVDFAAWDKMAKRMRAVSALRDFGLLEAPIGPPIDERKRAALAADIAAISGVYTVASGDGYRQQYPGTH